MDKIIFLWLILLIIFVVIESSNGELDNNMVCRRSARCFNFLIMWIESHLASCCFFVGYNSFVDLYKANCSKAL